MVKRDAPGPLATGACRQHKFARPHRVGAGPGDAGKGGNIENTNGDDGIDNACTKHRRQHDGRQDRGKGKREVSGAHDQFLHPPASRGSQQTQGRAHQKSDTDGNHAHQNGVARPNQQQRRDIPAEWIGPQPMLGIGLAQLERHVDFIRRPRRPNQRHTGGEDQQ